jgi:hypothetical protein
MDNIPPIGDLGDKMQLEAAGYSCLFQHMRHQATMQAVILPL